MSFLVSDFNFLLIDNFLLNYFVLYFISYYYLNQTFYIFFSFLKKEIINDDNLNEKKYFIYKNNHFFSIIST